MDPYSKQNETNPQTAFVDGSNNMNSGSHSLATTTGKSFNNPKVAANNSELDNNHDGLIHQAGIQGDSNQKGTVFPEQRRVHNVDNLSKTNLYIRGLQSNTNDQDLYKMCQDYGEISSTKAIIDKATGCCRGYGFVEFTEQKSAELAVKDLTKSGIQAQMAKISPLHQAQPNNNNNYKNYRNPSGNYNPISNSAQQNNQSKMNPNNHADPTNLYIANLPPNMTEQELGDLLSQYGPVVSTRILRDQISNVPRGVGFARMESKEKCEHIIKLLNGKPVEGSKEPLLLKFADGGNKKRRQPHQHHNPHHHHQHQHQDHTQHHVQYQHHHHHNHHHNNNNNNNNSSSTATNTNTTTNNNNNNNNSNQNDYQNQSNNNNHNTSSTSSSVNNGANYQLKHQKGVNQDDNKWRESSNASDLGSISSLEHQTSSHSEHISDLAMMAHMGYPRLQPGFSPNVAGPASYPSALVSPPAGPQWIPSGPGQPYVIPQQVIQPANLGPASQASAMHYGHIPQLAYQMQGLQIAHHDSPVGGYLAGQHQWSSLWPHQMGSGGQQGPGQNQMRLSHPMAQQQPGQSSQPVPGQQGPSPVVLPSHQQQ